jgi:crotonobetainyl-CoA:carnitine CoA-transferase CaiB-like acyl-CoA transferase
LEDVRVIDFSQAWAGPIASMMMGDLGADICKIEPPGIGDHVRKWTRPDLYGKSPYYLSANRNKRGMVIDLKTEAGRELALELADKADVLLENFRPGTMDKLGLGYDVIAKRNPSIIYCSVSGYGSTGPYAQRAAYDLLVQGESGLLSVTGQPNGERAKVGVPVVDAMSANVAAFTILAALIGRSKDGLGRRLDMSMLEVASTAMSTLVADFELSGHLARPMGTGNQLLAPYQVFATATLPIVLGVLTEVHWKFFCDVIKRPDLLSDPRFGTAPVRVTNRDALNEQINPILKSRPAKEWIEIFGKEGLACGFVNDVESLVDHPQHTDRSFFQTFQTEGYDYRIPGTPWRVGEMAAPTPPPEMGEHTVELLKDWLGMDDAAIGEFERAGVIVCRQAVPA